MITAILALADSPLVWFLALVAAVTGAGFLFRLLLLTAPDSMEEPPNATIPEDPRAFNYHRSDQFGR